MEAKSKKEKSAISERLNEIRVDKQLSKALFSRSIGKSVSYLSSMNENMTIEVLNNILSKYPEYNIWWILHGTEPKLVADMQSAAAPAPVNDRFYDYLIKQNDDLSKRIEELNREVGRLETQLMGLGQSRALQDTTADYADVRLLKSAE